MYVCMYVCMYVYVYVYFRTSKTIFKSMVGILLLTQKPFLKPEFRVKRYENILFTF
jgi:hypothetical protein